MRCCCAPMTRRRFMSQAAAWAGGLAVGSVLPLWPAPEAEATPGPLAKDATAELLKPLIERYTQIEDDPWVVMHGIRAMGAGLTVKGQSAVDLVCSRFLQEADVGGRRFLTMSLDHQGHTDTFLKTLLEAGVGLDHPFRLNGRGYRVGDLLESAKRQFQFDPKTIDPDDVAWSLIAFSLVMPPDHDTWTNATDRRVRLRDVIAFGFDTLDKTSERLARAKSQGIMPTGKDAIHGFTCGGTHLIYALATVVGNGYHEPNFASRLRSHLDLLIWRLDADWGLWESHYKQANAVPGQGNLVDLYYRDAILKFYGHAHEILSYARLHGLYVPSRAQSKTIDRASERMLQAVKGIVDLDLLSMRKTKRPLFHLLIGDSCHAYHGLRMAMGINQVKKA